MTVGERLLAAELRHCSLGFFSQARNFVCDVHAKPAGYELSDRQRAYLFHLGYRYRGQLPEFLAERSEEFRQQAATLYAQAEGASTKKVKPQKASRAEAVDDPDTSSPMLPLFMNGGFFG
jgi:hypothetical protein